MSSIDDSPDLHFHSGTNQPGRLEALARLRQPAGLTVGEASVGVRDWLLNVGPAYKMKLFVDSGAFSEFRGKVEPDWDDVMTFGLQLAKAYGRSVSLVAPDKVGDPGESFRRLKAYGPGIKAWISAGAKVLIPIQRGADASAYMRSAAKAIGCQERQLIPAFPMMEKAWEPDEVISAVRKMRPKEIHVLGRGPKRVGMTQLILDLRAAAPGLTLTTDSCTWASITPKGRPYALAGPRVDQSPLSHAAGWLDFDLGDLEGSYNEFLSESDRLAMLPLTGGVERLLWLLDPDAWISKHGLNDWLAQEIEARWTLDPRMRSTLVTLQALGGQEHDHEINVSLAEGHLVTQDDGRALTFKQLRDKARPTLQALGLADVSDQDERLREELDKLSASARFKHQRGSVKLTAFLDSLAGRRKLPRMSLDAALRKAGSRSTAPYFELTTSPLEYTAARHVQRLQLVEPNAPEPARAYTYFQPVVKIAKNRKTRLPGADPHVVAFADFSTDPDGSLFLHFFTTREDLHGQGLGRKLISELYERFAEAPEINWGHVVSAGSEKLWKERRQISTGPRTRGKLF